MKNINVYAVMCEDMGDVEVVMVFDDKENAEMYKCQIEEENEGCGYKYYIEKTKAIISI